MSISDVMSQLSSAQQLAAQLAAAPTPLVSSAPTSFADVLNAASSPAASTATGGSTDPAATGADSSAASGTAGTNSQASVSEASMLASMLEQSQAQSLLGTLGDSSSDDGLGDLGGLDSLEALLPTLTSASGSTGPATSTAGSTDTATSAAGLSTTPASGSANAPSAAATGASGQVAPAPSAAGARLLAAAESQLGVQEQPLGSNDGPQIAVYRSAVAGAQPGEPWCAYFASWAAAQAGEPLGSDGQGFGSVAQLTAWASQNGRLLPASATPAPGDLILFGDEHVGIVESVNPDGSLTTVEGNYANAVTQVHRLPSEATGYVEM
jgi:hypothetical protein